MLGKSTLMFDTDSGSRYMYDDNSGAVIPVNDLLVKAIDLCSRHDIDRVREELLEEFPALHVEGALKFIERWRKAYGGFFRTESVKSIAYDRMRHFSKEEIVTSLSSSKTMYRQLILNITEDCNLRCKYCVFSDNYRYTRKPSKRTMSFETGRKAIDYFFALNEPLGRRNPAKQLAINFYGGEPLLARSTMSRLIDYTKKKSNLPFSFFMTTNGLLLDDEVADFIVDNNINVLISLDGTRENHDRNRVTTGGNGSWGIVYKNIRRFMKRHPVFALKNLSIICVYDLNTDLEANEKFFRDNKLPRVSFVDAVSPGSDDDNYYKRFTDADIKRFDDQGQRLMKRYKEDLLDGTAPSNFTRLFCGSRFLNILIHQKAYDKRLEMIPFTGTCMPGEKISVRIDGTFDMCERVNSSMPIGNVDKGLDIDAITRIIKRYNDALGRKCMSCPVTKMCGVCFGDGICMKDGEFTISEEKRCRYIRSEQAQHMSIVYSILEIKKDAFKWFHELMERPERYYGY